MKVVEQTSGIIFLQSQVQDGVEEAHEKREKDVREAQINDERVARRLFEVFRQRAKFAKASKLEVFLFVVNSLKIRKSKIININKIFTLHRNQSQLNASLLKSSNFFFLSFFYSSDNWQFSLKIVQLSAVKFYECV